MTRTLLITGATDGIGLETAKLLAAAGHTLLIHGRSKEKLTLVEAQLRQIEGAGTIEIFQADLSQLGTLRSLAHDIRHQHQHLDGIINNAGVYKLAGETTVDGLDLRFVVNTIAPYLLTRELLSTMNADGRIINLSSAAQAPVDLEALRGEKALTDSQAYAQSKLALTMWSIAMAAELGEAGPAVIAVNPASFLASKMVKDAYGMAGNDLSIGADILVRAALAPEFAHASGRYFDNDAQRFAHPHSDAMDSGKNEQLLHEINAILANYL